jgi:hypothetical protein
MDRVPALGLVIYQDERAWPEASFTKQSVLFAPALAGPSSANDLPMLRGSALHPTTGGFEGAGSGRGAVFVGDQFSSGWRATSGGATSGPQKVFGWAMRFPVAGRRSVRVLQPSQTPRRLEIGFVALMWLAALWLTRRPSRA